MADFNAIAKKWQKKWEDADIYKTQESSKKPKCYVLEMYPYPSASFLHMGHVRNYTIGDVYARYKRMNGFNVLYPMGYDSFGLPAETAAKKEGIHPQKYTEDAIKKIMHYQKALGNSYDWDRVIASHDPDYYRWNQFFFIKFFQKGLAYRKKAPVNWCPNCQSVLANEESEGGRCWRCDGDVTKKELEQWFFKITDYAERLLSDLDKIDWPDRIKVMQRNWIGRSEGVDIFFKIEGSKEILPAFTTRCDTIFSVTFIAMAPEHPILPSLVAGTEYEKPVMDFVAKAVKEQLEDRINEEKEKEGVFIGRYAINPATKEKIPVYVANFAVMYGTGIVMCDAHDKRDFRFARKYRIPIKFVISPEGKPINPKDYSDAFTDDGILFDSGQFSGLPNREALPKMAHWLEENKFGKLTVNYKIKDWLISRQRYWGTPIPMIHCDKCGLVPVPEKDLPVLLPEKVDFKSANPLAANKSFVNVKCPKCGGSAKRETDTMGGFVDSSWYFLRYCDNKNKDLPFSAQKVRHWMPVDQYIGGAEHAVMHLMYARFFIKALKDLGYVEFDEPFTRLFNQGIVYKDGAKMSKSKGNVVYQTDISDKYGIDTARLFLMSVAAPDKVIEWNDAGIEGSFRFLNRLYAILSKELSERSDRLTLSKMHRTIRDVSNSIDNFDYSKSIIMISEFANYLNNLEKVPMGCVSNLLLLIAPFTPHIAEEMWETLGNKKMISVSSWPVFDESLIDDEIEAIEDSKERLVFDIKKVLEITGIKKPAEIKIFISPKWKYALYAILKEELSVNRDPKLLIAGCMKTPELRQHGEEVIKIITSVLKDASKMPSLILSQEQEIKELSASRNSIEKQFATVVKIAPSEESKEPKAKTASPSKPAIVIA